MLRSHRPEPVLRALCACLLIAAATAATGCSSDPEPNDANSADAVGDGATDGDDQDAGTGTETDDGPDSAPDVADPETSGDAGSDSDAADPDAETDADAANAECPRWWTPIPRTEPASLDDPNGPNPDQPFVAGTARAGQIRDGDAGFSGLYADCAAGHYVLENDHLRACIAGATSTTQMLFDGGYLVDLELREAPGADELYYLVPASGLQNAGSDGVTILNDGSTGGPAVIRTSGPDVIGQFFGATVGALVPSIQLDFETEYRLAPAASSLEIVTWIRRADTQRRVASAGDVLAGGDTTRSWQMGAGFDAPGVPTPTQLFVSIGHERSYAITSPALQSGALTLPEIEIPFADLRAGVGLLCPGDEASYSRHVAVGFGGTVTARRDLAGLLPPRETKLVAVSTDVGAGWDRPRYELRTPEGDSVDVIALNSGSAQLELPLGTWTITPMAWPLGDAPVIEIDIDAETEAIALPAPALAEIRVEVTAGGDATPSPALVRYSGPVAGQFFVTRGAASAFVPPGDYRVWVSRGEEFSDDVLEVLATPGNVAEIVVNLVRVFETPGWVSGDLHQHATPSPDSQVPIIDRLLSNLAVGVDFMGPSDHDAVGNFEQVAAELRILDLLFVFVGEEVSPGAGHLNAFPRRYDPAAMGGGGLPLGVRTRGSRETLFPTQAELVAQLRADGAELIQINHPRHSLSQFTTTAYDPLAGPDANDHEQWFDDFDAIEVLNIRRQFCPALRDWLSLLSRGYRVAGLGNSDTHDIDAFPGWPRNYVSSPTDAPAELTDRILLDGILAQQVFVSGGILMDFTDGTLPGDTVTVEEDGAVTIPVRLRAPAWASVDELIVIVNGRIAERIDIDSGLGTPFEDELSVNLELARDSYVVLIAHSATQMTRVHPGKFPVAFSNPVYFDIGGDGWSAPGVESADDVPAIDGIALCQ